jgi:dihydrofolate reductase
MAKLIYAVLSSLDGYTADADGDFSWAEPDAQVHAYVNDLERPIGTYLYGRRLYEVMTYWETADSNADHPVEEDFARIWKAADKVVYSRTLSGASTAKTRIESAFDPARIREMKAGADRDLSIGGAELAGQALRAGLVDECHFFLAPVVVGGGTRSLPDGVRLSLELVDEHRFDAGFVHMHYRVRP